MNICRNNSPSAQFTDWEIVVFFYSALHYVDAFLAKSDRHPNGHPTRNKLVATTPELQSIYTKYINLYERSREARYTLLQFSQQYVLGLYTQDFRLVKEELRKLLGLSP